MNILPLWPRIQMAKLHYQMGSISRNEFIYMLGQMFKEASKLREANHG